MTNQEILKHLEEIEMQLIVIGAITTTSITVDNDEANEIQRHTDRAKFVISEMKKEII